MSRAHERSSSCQHDSNINCQTKNKMPTAKVDGPLIISIARTMTSANAFSDAILSKNPNHFVCIVSFSISGDRV